MPNTYANIAGKRITGTVDEVSPDGSGLWPAARQWKVTLRCEGRRMTLDYYGGDMAECTIGGVVETLDSDSTNGASFEDWCGDYGYDTDSRAAEATYRAVVKQEKAFNRLLAR